VSAFVNALRDRMTGRSTLSSSGSSMTSGSSKVTPPARAVAPVRMGAPERSDWARRLMELGELAKVYESIFSYESAATLSKTSVGAWSTSSFSDAR
jgi:hypothetical protein